MPLYQRPKRGRTGPPGKSVQGKPGRDGRDAPPVDLEELIARIIRIIPKPKDGKDGKDGKRGPRGYKGDKGDRGTTGRAIFNRGGGGAPSNTDHIPEGTTNLYYHDELVDARLNELGVLTISIPFMVDGGSTTVTTGIKGDLEVPFDCVIQEVTMLADQTGSIEMDIWRDEYANFPPTVSDSIVGANPPKIVSDLKSKDTALSGWTREITAGDILRFNVNSATTIRRVTIALKVQKV